MPRQRHRDVAGIAALGTPGVHGGSQFPALEVEAHHFHGLQCDLLLQLFRKHDVQRCKAQRRPAEVLVGRFLLRERALDQAASRSRCARYDFLFLLRVGGISNH